MDIDVSLTHDRIVPAPGFAAAPASGVGSWVEFAGVVRDLEAGAPIAALEYEAYPTMALAQMQRILESLGREHPCQSVRVVHRVGVIPAGEIAIHVAIASAHRREGFALLAAFMDQLKLDVPIWKVRALPVPPPPEPPA